MPETELVTYEGANVPEAEVRAGLDELLASLPTDELLRDDVRREGQDPDQLFSQRDGAITVESEGAGFGAETLILIALAQHVGKRLWDKVLEPRLLDRLGQDALGKRRDDS